MPYASSRRNLRDRTVLDVARAPMGGYWPPRPRRRAIEALATEAIGATASGSWSLLEMDWDKLPLEMQNKIAEHMLKMALGDDPVVVEDARRRLEAGETVTIEDCTRVVEQQPGK